MHRNAAALLLWASATAANVEAQVPADCGQIVLVVTENWQSPTGDLLMLEKTEGIWSVQKRFPATVGHRGLAIGRGLHAPELAGPVKREGDQCAPAGIFRLESAFGTKRVKLPHFPYRRTDGQDRWVDDPASAFYNQWVRLDDPRIRRDWKSGEILHRDDGLYELAIIVGHNREPVEKGSGSAIFMHRWYEPGRSTIGCTAMAPENLRVLAEWLDQRKDPVLVQAPRELLGHLKLPEPVIELLR